MTGATDKATLRTGGPPAVDNGHSQTAAADAVFTRTPSPVLLRSPALVLVITSFAGKPLQPSPFQVYIVIIFNTIVC